MRELTVPRLTAAVAQMRSPADPVAALVASKRTVYIAVVFSTGSVVAEVSSLTEAVRSIAIALDVPFESLSTVQAENVWDVFSADEYVGTVSL